MRIRCNAWFVIFAVCNLLGVSAVTNEALAQGYNVGDSVECDGRQIGMFESGRVVGITPRPGWPDPFYEVQPDDGGSVYKCLPKFMRPGGGGGGAAAGAPQAPQAPAGQMPPAGAPPAPAGAAATFQVGDNVMCDGRQIGMFEAGRVVGITPRPGWPDPFYEVQPADGGSVYKCLPKFMRPGGAGQGAAAPPPPPPPAAPPGQTAAALQAPAAGRPVNPLCVPGTQVEAGFGISWYPAVVIGPPTRDGRCPVRRDTNDEITVSMDSLRPPGSGPVVEAQKPPGRPAAPGQAAPDGVYACNHMAAMGTSMGAMGQVDVRGGVPTFRGGLPDGWTMRQVRYEGTDGQGRPKIVVDYTSKAGFNDRLDCFPR